MPKGEDLSWKVMGGVAAIGAGMAARKGIKAAWKMTTGKEPPANPEHPDVAIVEALGWAVLSGAVVGIARMMASRVAAERWRRSKGELPPGLREA
ncbi:MAG: DUF4235 domain-containing protein [Streptosporangiaceae bacterium]